MWPSWPKNIAKNFKHLSSAYKSCFIAHNFNYMFPFYFEFCDFKFCPYETFAFDSHFRVLQYECSFIQFPTFFIAEIRLTWLTNERTNERTHLLTHLQLRTVDFTDTDYHLLGKKLMEVTAGGRRCGWCCGRCRCRRAYDMCTLSHLPYCYRAILACIVFPLLN